MTSLSRATFQIDENQSFEQGMFLPEESFIRDCVKLLDYDEKMEDKDCTFIVLFRGRLVCS